MLCFKFHKNRTINEEFDFWGVKRVVLVGLGVAKVGTTKEHVPKPHRRLFLPKTFVRYLFEVTVQFVLVRWIHR